MRMFAASGKPQDISRYVDCYRLFKRGEPWAICQTALASGPKDTRELSLELMKAKGMDAGDKVLAEGLTYRTHPFPADAGWTRKGESGWKAKRGNSVATALKNSQEIR